MYGIENPTLTVTEEVNDIKDGNKIKNIYKHLANSFSVFLLY